MPLPSTLRHELEPRFGFDFSRVRLHAGTESAAAARALSAKAYTVGADIVFGAGQYDPFSLAGQRLLAHELTHVVQQSGAPACAPIAMLAPPHGPLEREAQAVSALVATGASVAGAVQPRAAVQVQREPLDVPSFFDWSSWFSPNSLSALKKLANFDQSRRNWEKSVVGALEVEYKKKFSSFDEARKAFHDKLDSLKPSERHDYARSMFDRAKKRYNRAEGGAKGARPSQEWSAEQSQKLRKGKAFDETVHLDHEVEMQDDPYQALDAGNLEYITGGEGGTSPKGSLHYKKTEAERAARAERDKTVPADIELGPAGAAPEKAPAAKVAPEPATPSVAAPSTTAPSTTAPSAAEPRAPKVGSVHEDRLTLDYDVRDPAAPELEVRRLDLSDYPSSNRSGVLRYFDESPMVRGLGTAAMNAGAQIVVSQMLEKLQGHFIGILEHARAEFERAYPPADALWYDSEIDYWADVYESVMAMYYDENLMRGSLVDIEQNLEGAFTYESKLMRMQEELEAARKELTPIHDDIQKRADVILACAHNVENSFAWIHKNVVGSAWPVYYESFWLWTARGIFMEVGGRVNSFAVDISLRQTEYKERYEKIDKRLDALVPRLNLFRKLYQQNKKLLSDDSTTR